MKQTDTEGKTSILFSNVSKSDRKDRQLETESGAK